MKEKIKNILEDINKMKSQILKELNILLKPTNIIYNIKIPTKQFIEKYKELNKIELLNTIKEDNKDYLNNNIISEINPNLIKFTNTHDKIISPYIQLVNKYMLDSYNKNKSKVNKVEIISPLLKKTLLEKINKSFSNDELIKFNKIVNEMGFSVDYNEISRIMGKTKTECILMSFWCLEKNEKLKKELNLKPIKKIKKLPLKKSNLINKKLIKNNIIEYEITSDINLIQSASDLIQKWTIDERRIFALYFPHFKKNWIKMVEFIPSKQIEEIKSFYFGYFKKLKPKEREFEQILINIPNNISFNKVRRLSLINITNYEILELENSGALFLPKGSYNKFI